MLQESQPELPLEHAAAAADQALAAAAAATTTATATATATAADQALATADQALATAAEKPLATAAEKPLANISSMPTSDVTPTEMDVICSRGRKNNPGGNGYYWDLLNSCRERLAPIIEKVKKESAASGSSHDSKEMSRIYAEASKCVVEKICKDRGGRFLKLINEEGSPPVLAVMTEKEALAKATAALRRPARPKKIRVPKPPKPPKQKVTLVPKVTVASVPVPKQPTKKKVPKRTLVKSSHSRYRIEFPNQEQKSIDPYMIQLITAVCNHPLSEQANRLQVEGIVRILDTYQSQETTNKQRIMRLQLRHRYLGAARNNVSPVMLSQRLIQFWGGVLLFVKGVAPPVVVVTAAAPVPAPVVPSPSGPLEIATNDTGTMLVDSTVEPSIPITPLAGAGQKNPWSAFETIKLLEGIQIYGVGKWDPVHAMIPSRTKLQVQSRYNNMMRRVDQDKKGEAVLSELVRYRARYQAELDAADVAPL